MLLFTFFLLLILTNVSLFCKIKASVKAQNDACHGPEVLKKMSCSAQRSTKFILLINVTMSTIVGILTFIRMINTTFESLKARHVYFCHILVVMSN